MNNFNNVITPMHEHDCEKCRFCGCFVGKSPDARIKDYIIYDLYHCPNSFLEENGSLIARFGTEADYISRPVTLIKSLVRQGKHELDLSDPVDFLYMLLDQRSVFNFSNKQRG